MAGEHGHDGTAPGVRLALLDEYPALVDGLADGLEAEPGFEVVLRAATGRELADGVAARPCDVVVAEPWLRSADGLDAIREIVEAHPGITVVVFSRVWDDNHVQQVMDLGVRAYVPKHTDVSALPAIIRSARDGLVIRPPRTGSAGGDGASLTPREVEVLGLAADGLDNSQIAATLFVTERTVKFHLQNAYRKLGARSRTEAAAIARRKGLLS